MNVVPSSSSPQRNARAPSRVASLRPATPISPRIRRSPLWCATRPTVSARRARSRREPTGASCHRWRPGKRRRGSRLSLPGLEEAAAVAHAVDAAQAWYAEAREGVREERCEKHEIDKLCLRQVRPLLPCLEADVL